MCIRDRNKIKERFNEEAAKVTIDVKGFLEALLKKKDVSNY